MYSKPLNAHLAEIHECIGDLGLNHITVPSLMTGDTLVTQAADYVSRHELDVGKLYADCLRHLYCHEHASYSGGIYAYFSHSDRADHQSDPFLDHLEREMEAAVALLGAGIRDDLRDIFTSARDRFARSIVDSAVRACPLRYTLLHGDLHVGNIVMLDDRYRLIDFEYMRVGPREMDLSFLLCWDFFSDAPAAHHARETISRDLDQLSRCGIVDAGSMGLIVDALIPMYQMLACLYVSAGKYRDTRDYIEGLTAFGDIDIDWRSLHQSTLA